MRRGLLVTLAAFLILLVAVLAAGTWIWLVGLSDTLRPLVLQRLERLTGRQVAIGEDFSIEPSLVPTFSAGDVTVANSDWGSEPHMLRADKLAVRVRLLPLIRDGDVIIERLALSGATLLLERSSEGEVNWRFGAGEGGSDVRSAAPLLSEVLIEDSLLRWREPERSETLGIERLHWTSATAAAPLLVEFKGRWRDLPLSAEGELGPLTKLLADQEPWPLALQGRIAELAVAAEGSLGLGGAEGELALDIEGDTGALKQALAFLPERLGPVELSGRLLDPLSAPRFEALNGSLVFSDIAFKLADGIIRNPAQLAGLELPLSAEAQSLAALGSLLGVSLPALRPLRGEARLLRPAEGSVTLEELRLSAGGKEAAMTAEGEVQDLFGTARFDLALKLEGSSLAALDEGLKVELPDLGAFSLETGLTGEAANPQLHDLKLQVAGLALAGDLALALAEDPPRIAGTLRAPELDVMKVADLVRTDGEESGAEQKQSAADEGPLEGIAADVALTVEKLLLGGTPVGQGSGRIVLGDGKLTLNKLDLALAGGRAKGDVTVDTGPKGPAVAVGVAMRAEEIDLSELLTAADMPAASDLELDFEMSLSSHGDDLAALLDELEGQVEVASGEGQLQDTDLNRLVQDLDVMRLVLPFWRQAKAVRVNCLVGEFDFDEGEGETKLLLDTSRMRLLGEGRVDLGEGNLALRLDPQPKSGKLSTTGVPVEVTGELTDPQVKPAGDEAVGRLLGGILGGLLMPLNQLTSIFGQKAGEACAQAVQQGISPQEAERPQTAPSAPERSTPRQPSPATPSTPER